MKKNGKIIDAADRFTAKRKRFLKEKTQARIYNFLSGILNSACDDKFSWLGADWRGDRLTSEEFKVAKEEAAALSAKFTRQAQRLFTPKGEKKQ